MIIEYGTSFKKQLKRLARRYRSIQQDVQPVITALEAGQTPGDQLSHPTYLLYKVRAANRDSRSGKSGGYRIIYYLKTDTHCILVTIYSKSDQGDVSSNELEKLLKDITSN